MVCEVELRCLLFLSSRKQRQDYINFAKYVYKNMSARRRAQLVPYRNTDILFENLPPKTTKMMSTRNSSMPIMSSSVCFLFESKSPLKTKQ